MSLEARLESLEKAVVNLTAIIEKSSQPAANAAPASSPDQGAARSAATSTKGGKGKPRGRKPKEPEQSPEDRLEKVVKPLVLKCVEKAGREATISVLAEFGAKTASNLSPDQYDEAIAALNDAIKTAEAGEDDLAA